MMTWHGCYDASWRGLIVDDAFAHPAKAARGLVVRIFDYLFERGWLKRGGLVVDPFGGIGTTAIEGSSRGCRVVCCELEQKFVDLAQRNFDLHRRTWEACDDPLPVMVQGDSRRLLEAVGPVLADVVASSPPYNLPMSQDHNGKRGGKRGTNPSEDGAFVKYGNTPGQLEGMPMGDVADVIVSSPPFLDARSGTEASVETKKGGPCADRVHSVANGNLIGQTPGQLANLAPGSVADCVVSSPPWESNLESGGGIDVNKLYDGMVKKHGRSGTPEDRAKQVELMAKRVQGRAYGDSESQLGNTTGQTFWQAAREIVQQSFAILKPGGVAVWITKDFVRKGQRVPFSDDWRKLCEVCGFELVEWIHASLVKERTHATLYGNETTRTERKSFFRRLAEKKGSPRIDHEDVLVMRKL